MIWPLINGFIHFVAIILFIQRGADSVLSLGLGRIFHRDGIRRAPQRDAAARRMPRQGLNAPARQAVRRCARCGDAMDAEFFAGVQTGFDKNDPTRLGTKPQKRVHGEICRLGGRPQLGVD